LTKFIFYNIIISIRGIISPLEISFNSSLSGGLKMTNGETRKLLQENGFVRVDGLQTSGFHSGVKDKGHIVGYHLRFTEGGCWDYNNEITAVFTTYRELWIRAGDAKHIIDVLEYSTSERLFVSNKDWPLAYQLLARVANPNYAPE